MLEVFALLLLIHDFYRFLSQTETARNFFFSIETLNGDLELDFRS
jgi:hypothetical protein